MKHVHLLCERFDGELRSSSFVRLLLPLRHPANAAHFRVTEGRTYEKADIVIVERTWEQDPHAAADLIARARRDGVCLVHSLDDDLLVLGKAGPLKKEFMTPHRVRLLELLARESDAILVSTARLKERMLFYNNRVFTVPNAIDEQLFDLNPTARAETPADRRPLVMGYMGTATHDADLLMIADALGRCLRKYRGALELQIVGGVSDPATLKAFAGLPIQVLRSGDAVEYPDFVRWMTANLRWDFAVAPLEDNAFTRCKSDLKFLDYSALGIPSIYSRVPPYEESVIHRETGYLAANHTDAWEVAIDYMVSRVEARAELACRAQGHVLARRTLRQNAAHWREALLDALAGQQGGTGRAATTRDGPYQRLLERVRQTVCQTIPLDGTVLVVGWSGDELLDLGRRRVWRFPQGVGQGQTDGPAVIAHFEELRNRGAGYLAVPATAFWWLDYLPDLKRHLESHYQVAVRDNACLIFVLRPAST